MAKTATRSRGAALAQRARTATRVVVARAAPIVRRAGSAAAAAAASEKHTLTAVAAAAAIGYAERENMLDRFSLVDSVDPKAQLGIALWVAGRYTKNKTIQHAASGVLAVSAYAWARDSG